MNLQIGVKLIIKNSDNQYLFLRRTAKLSTDTDEESWDIPGGRIDSHEVLNDALVREVKEEIGHSLQGTPTLLAAQDIFVPAKDLHVVRLTYLANEDVASIELSDEHDEYQWVDESSIKLINAEPYLTEVLKGM